jgi:hypothetical protein
MRRPHSSTAQAYFILIGWRMSVWAKAGLVFGRAVQLLAVCVTGGILNRYLSSMRMCVCA